ncbi:MAG: YfcE family phosphodiesterase [Oscillospiraceae bacterium]|jgi:putative phosphoesterase|nr:YfcE family phosphodiesterase [Oscillospiraceae bacterium]
MKITVFADTHRNFHNLKRAVELNLDSDLFIHLGDGYNEFDDVEKMFPQQRFVFVKGNCDFNLAKSQVVVAAGVFNIYCVHGDTLDVKNGTSKLIEAAKDRSCSIALYGHTHLYKTEYTNGVYVMNPGSLDCPRGKNPVTYGVIDISSDGKVNLSIVELPVVTITADDKSEQ